VTKIEVEDIVSPGEDDPDEHYFRTIRFVGYRGESIEVFCDAFDNKNVLRLHRVKQLTPVAKPQAVDWLEPEVSTSDADKDTAQESD